jgi:acyl-CoA dehydrogenase
MLERVARSRVEIDTARLAVLNAAAAIDKFDAKGARREIAEIKILTPTMLQTIADRAMQSFGAAGLCQDTPLPELWVAGRVMRVVDGPDEVHLLQLGRDETARGKWYLEKIEKQLEATVKLANGATLADPLELNRIASKANL